MGVVSLPNTLMIFELFVGYGRVAVSVIMGTAEKASRDCMAACMGS